MSLTLKYSFDNTGLGTFKVPDHVSVINTNKTFKDLTYDPLTNNNNRKSYVKFSTVGNLTTCEVIYKYVDTTNKTINGEDGLSFKNVLEYYKGNSITILQFGGIPLSKSGGQFATLKNFTIDANAGAPTISTDTSLANSFYNCTNFNSNISTWDTSNVTNMSNMFNGCSSFSRDISGWITLNVKDMSYMFSGCNFFNSDISGWNTLNVTDMKYMFYGCTIFNSNISGWDVSKVTNFQNIFNGCKKFNQNLSRWNFPIVTYPIFLKYSFDNTGLGSTIYLPVINDNKTFEELQINVFDPSKSDFKTNTVGNLTTCEIRYKSISGTINGEDGLSFKNVLSYYNGNSITILQFDGIPLSNSGEQFANLKNLTIDANAGAPAIFSTTSLSKTFYNCPNFNSTISSWDFSKVTNMSYMFYNCSNFNSTISSWDFSNVTDMQYMFYGCTNFNQPIGSWNTSKVTNMQSMFYDCTNFNKDIGGWNVLNVTNMQNMFYNCINFNQDLSISKWNTSNVTEMFYMFHKAALFNNKKTSMNWNCNAKLYSNHFGLKSKLYLNGDYTKNPGFSNINNIYKINPGYANRNISGGGKNIQTQTYTLNKFTFYTNLQNFDKTKHLPIINSSGSFISNSYCVTEVPYNNVTKVTYTFYCAEILGDDGLSFKDVAKYYTGNSVTIENFDGIPLSKAGSQFMNLTNLSITATDTPIILPNTSLSNAFYNCTNFNSNISNWDVSNVTNMDSMFENATNFNSNISNWDVSNVTNMDSMFQNATKFNNNNINMNWTCSRLTSASNFGLNSSLYPRNDYKINAGCATRLLLINNSKQSIETPIYNYNYGLFIFETNSQSANTQNLPIINTNYSFTFYDVTIERKNNTTFLITIPFSYSAIIGNDGLSFTNVAGLYTNNNNSIICSINIIDFGGIPLSSYNDYKFQDVPGFNISVPYNIIPSFSIPTDITSDKRIYYTEFTSPGFSNIYKPTKNFTKIGIYLIAGGGSGGTGEVSSINNGGGGGSFAYYEVLLKSVEYGSLKINVGKGGDIMKAANEYGENGSSSGVYLNDDYLIKILGGEGGASAIAGGGSAGASLYYTKTDISINNFLFYSGFNGGNSLAGKSGYSSFINHTNINDPNYFIANPSSYPYGDGGRQGGANGYARVYYIT